MRQGSLANATGAAARVPAEGAPTWIGHLDDLGDDNLTQVLQWLPAPALRACQATCARWAACARPLFSSVEWQARSVLLSRLIVCPEGLEDAIPQSAELYRGGQLPSESERAHEEALHRMCAGHIDLVCSLARRSKAAEACEALAAIVAIARKARAALLAQFAARCRAGTPESAHAARLVQTRPAGLEAGRRTVSLDPATWRCDATGLVDPTNMWLNLSTGHVGSGRRQFDGTGGTNGALIHYEATGRKHPLVVKLGTITARGPDVYADVYSYADGEDCDVRDPLLSEHLAFWGIDARAAPPPPPGTATSAELNFEVTPATARLWRVCFGEERLGPSALAHSAAFLAAASAYRPPWWRRVLLILGEVRPTSLSPFEAELVAAHAAAAPSGKAEAEPAQMLAAVAEMLEQVAAQEPLSQPTPA